MLHGGIVEGGGRGEGLQSQWHATRKHPSGSSAPLGLLPTDQNQRSAAAIPLHSIRPAPHCTPSACTHVSSGSSTALTLVRSSQDSTA